MILLLSSVLAYYAAAYSHPASPSAHVALAWSHWLRRTGKLLAIVNSIWIVLVCLFQYSNFYDTCFCKSSVIGRGKGAYAVIIESAAQASVLKTAWICALALAHTSSFVFLGSMNLLLRGLPPHV